MNTAEESATPPSRNYQDDLEERALEDFETAASLRKLLRQVGRQLFQSLSLNISKDPRPSYSDEKLLDLRSISKSYKRLKGGLIRSMSREAEVEISEIGKIPHRLRASEVPCFSSQRFN